MLAIRYSLPIAASVNPSEGRFMATEYQVQKAGLAGQNWVTICRGSEARAREVFLRQLRFYTVGRFRLVGPGGVVVAEAKATPVFSDP
jgi:hypothetical protein